MSLFTEWNSLLLEEYFSPTKANQEIWISTTKIELEGIGVHKGGASGLIEAVKQGPNWLSGESNIAIKAFELVRQRQFPSKRPEGYCDPELQLEHYKGRNAPTYLPYIALWVFAKSEAKENGFYSKVGELISQPFPNNVRREMEAAWADLEHWSNRVNRGMFGCFNVTVLGQHKFVGMAYAQAMITRKDISGISRLFGSCKLHSGQILTNEHFEKLIEHGKSSYFLSSGLKTAMGKSEYREHLKQLFKVYLELWDGYIPRSIKDCRQEPIKRDERQSLVDDEITIILKPKTVGEEHCWEIGWRLPATVTGQNYAIRFKDCEETKAKLELMGTHIHSISSANQKDAWYTLNQSATEYVDSFLIYTGNDGDRNEKQFYLRQDKVRVLIWDSPDPSLHNSLMEREMPLMGPVYLLYSRINYSNLELYLINEKIEHEMVDANGLPACWGLVCIQNASNLTDEQRALLVENEPAAISKARIRFVGGRPIIGAGSKKYAYYDLPIVELEAPAGAELSSFGLTFKELKDPHGGYLRRFNFCLDESSGSVFKIQAKLGSEILSTVGLHVLTAGGTSISHRSHFSIDNFGRPLADASGLRGAIVGHTQVVVTDSIVDAFRLDKWNRMDIWECMESNVASRFLDSVATTLNGSMNIGVARDQIMRLASSKGLDDIEPNFLIYELRRRGHIEIETDVKGHMVRVCAVPPTLYSLPIKDSEQRQFYGICGSLRLQQWKSLSQATDVKLLIDAESLKDLPSVRVIPIGLEAISSIAKSANFQVADLPIMHLSQWLGSIQELKESLSWYPEQGFEPNDLERLNPALGRFNTAGNVLVDSERKYELFRYDDPQIHGRRVYKLGQNIGDGISKYSFIQDSRWGVWMAVGAFAEFMAKPPYNLIEASPWPIHYESATGFFWIPARLSLPFVLERVLVLCSGEGPANYKTTIKKRDESIVLLKKNQQVIGEISQVYSAMASGEWLCYRYVPKLIAGKIASLLGGKLIEMGNNMVSERMESKNVS